MFGTTHIRLCVSVWVCYLLVHSAKTEPNELKLGTQTMSAVGFLQPLQTLAAKQIVGQGAENVRWVTEIRLNLLPKLVSTLEL